MEMINPWPVPWTVEKCLIRKPPYIVCPSLNYIQLLPLLWLYLTFVALYRLDLCLECYPSLLFLNILFLQWALAVLIWGPTLITGIFPNASFPNFRQMGISFVSFSVQLDISVSLSQSQLKGDYVQHWIISSFQACPCFLLHPFPWMTLWPI